MSTLNTTVTTLTGIAGAGVGAVIHNAWADLRAYLRTHRALVEAEADAALNKGIDIVIGTEGDSVPGATTEAEPAESARKAEPSAEAPSTSAPAAPTQPQTTAPEA